MSAFLHQIFYANNKFGSDSNDDIYATFGELSKWSIPKPVYITQIEPPYETPTVISPAIPHHTTLIINEPNELPVSNILPEDGLLPSVKSIDIIPFHKSIIHNKTTILYARPPPVHPKNPSNLSIFQSVFISHHGYSEYIMAGNRMPNRELEEKQRIMETLSKTPKKLKEGNHKLTNDNIQEILSGLLVATKEEIMHLVAYTTYYNRIIYLVFTHSYLIFSPTKEVSIDSNNIQSVYVLHQTRKHPKYGGSYYPDLELTLEKLDNIHNTKIHLEHYAKPFKGVSAYKVSELEEMAMKTGVFENGVPVKYKKKELYDKIVELCCAGITA